MVVLAKGELEQIALPAVHRAAPPLADVPEVDLAAAWSGGAEGRAAAARAVAAACEEHGFFKVTGHGVPVELLVRVEAAAAAFFGLQQREKEAAMSAASPGSPFGYASKRIGNNGDLGWVEYLLLGVTAAGASTGDRSADAPFDLLNEYTVAVRRMACSVLELMAEGLGMAESDAFARLVLHEDSDSMLRVNHYPPRPEQKQLHAGAGGNGRVTGFGEHTDPQIISVLRSNATSGLEIALRDGSWVSVPPDQSSFFVNVGDALQVLTNGRFRSVRHRVMVNSIRSRVSVIFFGGPPPRETLAPLPELVGEGGRRRYREFTWREYKASAYRTKLAENRLCHFETTS
ncbi:gibberellin 2-beta-dioxygenase 3-like isoform X4 [Lolium rigidum]|uniref:gibberellin 2-beta-dioxygenase 3-like isoform X4 n=1 Tax=Lolium rigidum TaxID=89674 RepID=UPI001F5DA80F|nr:gibberellin 2-beta-dioxygenase 3-like isoform X4 [Lolium rigidum]